MAKAVETRRATGWRCRNQERERNRNGFVQAKQALLSCQPTGRPTSQPARRPFITSFRGPRRADNIKIRAEAHGRDLISSFSFYPLPVSHDRQTACNRRSFQPHSLNCCSLLCLDATSGRSFYLLQHALSTYAYAESVLLGAATLIDNTLPTPYRREKERYTHTQSKQTGRDQKLQRRKPTLRKKPSANSLHHALPNPRPRGARLHHHRVAPEPETHAHARPTRPEHARQAPVVVLAGHQNSTG